MNQTPPSGSSGASVVRRILLEQYDVAWALAEHHLRSLTPEEGLWRPAGRCLHLVDRPGGGQMAELPQTETYDVGPPSVAWVLWHICFWWENTLAGQGLAVRREWEDLAWPGTKEAVDRITEFSQSWRRLLTEVCDHELLNPKEASWPAPDRSLAQVAAWLTVELTKNAAEIGSMRFLKAVADPGEAGASDPGR